MLTQALLLDLDNTLYDYKKAHEPALTSVLDFLSSRLQRTRSEILDLYNKGRRRVHMQLMGTAASHNRTLYFQNMLESIGYSPVGLAFEAAQCYWEAFLDHMLLRENVLDFLDKFEPRQLCLLTDLTADIQHRKLKKLGLDKLIFHLVTSEEAGHEKPHPLMFMLALEKLGLPTGKVAMIGDNWDKDIVGATQLGIYSYFYSESSKASQNDLVTNFTNFKQLQLK